MESSWAEKHSLRRSATMNDTLCCALHCPCAVDCSALHGIGHNSKYLGLAVDTLCHTKSWWTQGSHPHSFYTHSSTQEKSKMKQCEKGKTMKDEPSVSPCHVVFLWYGVNSCPAINSQGRVGGALVICLGHTAWAPEGPPSRLDFYRIDWYTIQYAMTCSCDDI